MCILRSLTAPCARRWKRLRPRTGFLFRTPSTRRTRSVTISKPRWCVGGAKCTAACAQCHLLVALPVQWVVAATHGLHDGMQEQARTERAEEGKQKLVGAVVVAEVDSAAPATPGNPRQGHEAAPRKRHESRRKQHAASCSSEPSACEDTCDDRSSWASSSTQV